MRKWSTRVLFAAGAVAVAAWSARPGAAELADVYLKNGLTLRGDVSVTDSEVVLRNAAGEARLPRAVVDRIVPLAATATQPVAVPPPLAAPPPDSEWVEQPALGVGEADSAASVPAVELTELPPAPPLSDADIQRLRLGELRLDGPAEPVRVRFLRRGRQRDLPLEVLESLRRRTDYRSAWEDVLLRGQPHEKLQLILRLTGTEHADRILVDSDPTTFDTFRRRVLPLVNRGCARSGCHGGKGARVFRFPLGATGGDTYAYTAFVLLDQLHTPHGPLLNRANPEESVLLSYLLPPEASERGHPPVGRGPPFRAPIRRREDRLYVTVLDWIDQLAVPRPNYGLVYQNPYAGRLIAPPAAPNDDELPPVATQPATRPSLPEEGPAAEPTP